MKQETRDSFFMKEQSMTIPDTYTELLENEDMYQSAIRVKTYIDSYLNQPRFIEDKAKMEH